MGVQFNTKGFVVIETGGQMTWDSMVSARSGKRTTPGGVLEAVPDTGGRLFARLLPREARQMSEAEYEAVFAAARAWYAALAVTSAPIVPAAESPEDSSESDGDVAESAAPPDKEPRRKRRKGDEDEA
jgi:hypothetical protein